ncbi:MAG: orotate phosphoribosyltransferase [Gammaproteobacteria bacterium]|nr:orotate phosphoribosyltransferase [Gammaproteobacteria bacterium]
MPPEHDSSEIAAALAARALHLQAIKLQPSDPFTWTSGYRMPIYNDNRLFLGSADDRKTIADGFAAVLADNKVEFDVIAGTATAGIPHATTLADLLRKPLIYVRSQAKGHGMQNRIEGPLKAGERVLLVEDLVSTGKSSISAAGALRDAGAELNCCLAIFSYGFAASAKAFSTANIALSVLLTFDFLLEAAVSGKFISDEERESLTNWSQDPFSWGESRGFPKI